MTHRFLLLLFLSLFLCSCAKQLDILHPSFQISKEARQIEQKDSPFPPLTIEERASDWGKEYTVGLVFAREGDFYRAITGFKRAYILAPQELVQRRQELQYHILLCYYQGQKYLEAIYTFEKSQLQEMNGSFPAFNDLVTILYDCYEQIGEHEKAQKLLEFVQTYAPDMAENLSLSSAIQTAHFPTLENRARTPEEKAALAPLLTSYRKEKKSPRKAQALNAALPGMGYFYLGQKKSALTAFLLNGGFIAAAAHFFKKGHTAAGLITTGFELGWYIGGINGAGLAAKQYNERLYEKYGQRILHEEKLFPLFMLSFHF